MTWHYAPPSSVTGLNGNDRIAHAGRRDRSIAGATRRRAAFVGLLLVCAGAKPLRATNDQLVVINEVCFAPLPGQEKFIEVLNRGTQPFDTVNWYVCQQPGSNYKRLLQVPQNPGTPPASPSFVLQPGDFLVIRAHPQDPPTAAGDYSTRPNSSGTTTHILRLFMPTVALPSYIRSDHNNDSIWDATNGDPDNPQWNVDQNIRDIVGWGEDGLFLSQYGGSPTLGKRLCVASVAVPALWTPAISGTCDGGDPTFAVINSLLFAPDSGISINYNGRVNNDTTDYFMAPATEGEANVMPGDMDGDFDMDNADYDAFVACIGQPASNPPCGRADLNVSGAVDCDDWPLFQARWQQYSQDPAPPTPLACLQCVRGDFNGDGQVNGDDIPGFLAVMTGGDTDPLHLCAADADASGGLDCVDTSKFVSIQLSGEISCRKGDVNSDGRANAGDIQPFIDRLIMGDPCLSPHDICVTDFNSDNLLTEEDIAGFADLLVTLPPDQPPPWP